MDAKMTWKAGLSFTGSADSGFTVPLGAEVAVGGAGDGFRPMELILTGLAGCTAMDVLSILQKKRQKITGFEVKVNAPRSVEHPKVFTSAVILYLVTGNSVDETAVLRSIELSFTKYCPVQKMLDGAVPMELHYEIYEDEGNGKRRLASQGVWQEVPQE